MQRPKYSITGTRKGEKKKKRDSAPLLEAKWGQKNKNDLPEEKKKKENEFFFLSFSRICSREKGGKTSIGGGGPKYYFFSALDGGKERGE